MASPSSFTLTQDALNPLELKQKLMDRRHGACVTFEGWVRDHNEGKRVALLEYEAWPSLCAKEAQVIFTETREKFSVERFHVVHRTGTLNIGDCAVWVGVSSPHRKEAFAACSFLIDELKHRLPIWKKEHYGDETAKWVACHRCAASTAPEKEMPLFS